MKSLAMLIKRNILIFTKDKSNVFFSLLSMFIIIVLNMVFLNKINVETILKIIPTDRDKAEMLVNAIVIGGIIAVNAITVTLSMTGIMIEDQENNRLKSFYVSPLSRSVITLGYIFSTFIMGCIFCFITFTFAEIYIFISGGQLLTAINMIKAIFFIILNVFSASCFVFLIASCIHSVHVFSSINVIIGTLVGFVGGLYVPNGQLPELVQKLIKCCPIAYGSSLIKEIFVQQPMSDVFSNADPNIIDSYKNYMAISISWNDTIINNAEKSGIMILSGLIFAMISVIVIKNKRVRDR